MNKLRTNEKCTDMAGSAGINVYRFANIFNNALIFGKEYGKNKS
jgi:hypothetical protein